MADRRVNVKLDGDSRSYVTAANRAADATDDLRQKAERFAGKSYNAGVGVNGAAKAAAEVDSVRRAGEALDGKTYRARAVVSTANSNRDVRTLASSIVALGPAAVAAGAAGVAGLGVMGSALGVVTAGAGVTALALSGVGEALKKLNTAQADPTAAKLKAARIAMDELSAAGQHFVYFLDGLEPQLEALQKVAQEGMLPGFEEGLTELAKLMPTVGPLVSEVADALGDLAAKGGRALNDPDTIAYFDFLRTNARPVLDGLASILANVASGFGGMQMAFGPMARDMIGSLDDLSAKFSAWGKTLDQSDGFRAFTDFVNEIGPSVGSTLTAVARALAAIAAAAAPLGGPVLGILETLANVIAAIAASPVGTPLVAFATALGMLNLGLKAFDTAKSSRLLGLMTGLGGSADGAAGGTGKLAAIARGLGPALGIAGVAVAGLAMAYDSMASKAEESASKVAAGSMTMRESYQKELDLLRQRESVMQGMTEGAAQGEAIGELTGKIDRNAVALREEYEAFGKAARGQLDYLAGLPPVQRAQAEIGFSQDRAAEAGEHYRKVLADLGAQHPATVQAAEAYRSKLADVEIREIMLAQGVSRGTAELIYRKSVLDGNINTSMAAERAALTFDTTLASATETLKTHSAKSLEGRGALMSLKESAVSAATSIGEKARKDAEATGSADAARIGAEAQKSEYLRLAEKVNEPLRSELRLMAEQINTLPDGSFSVTGEGKIADTITMNDGTKIPIMSTSLGRGGIASAARLATGGYVRGPGTTTSDDINAKLSDKEYVVRAAATQSLGVGTLDYINRTGQLPAFADGGVFQTGVHPFPQIAGALHSEITGGLVAGITAPLAAMVKDTEQSMLGGNGLAWAQSQAGKPYIWGGVGPAGYDCSGFMAAIMNVMDGRSPHMRRGTTGTFPWPGMVPGMGPGLSVGSTRNAGGGIGHMAGTIAGTNVESRGGRGVIVGPEARGAMDRLFNQVYHFRGRGEFVPGGSSAIEGGGLARQQVQAVASRYGWAAGAQWNALNALIGKESSWNPNARNPTSSAAGLFQKMQSIWGAVEQTPGGQAEWGLNYIRGRYGSPSAAWAFHQGHNYYDDGGLASGKGYMPKNVVAPERVLSPRQTVAFEQLVNVLSHPRAVSVAGESRGGDRIYQLTVVNASNNTVDLKAQFSRLEAMAGV